jgi:hypothetical protein
MRIGAMKGLKTKAEESIRLAYTGLRHSCCHTYIDTLSCTNPKKESKKNKKKLTVVTEQAPSETTVPTFLSRTWSEGWVRRKPLCFQKDERKHGNPSPLSSLSVSFLCPHAQKVNAPQMKCLLPSRLGERGNLRKVSSLLRR